MSQKPKSGAEKVNPSYSELQQRLKAAEKEVRRLEAENEFLRSRNEELERQIGGGDGRRRRDEHVNSRYDAVFADNAENEEIAKSMANGYLSH